MSNKLGRITITLPQRLVDEADTRARREKRSRSWVLAEALRCFLAEKPAPVVREPATPPYVVRPGLGEQRLAQFESDLALTPEQRVREAEQSTEAAFRIHRVPRAPLVLAFERYEDYLDWKRRDLLW